MMMVVVVMTMMLKMMMVMMMMMMMMMMMIVIVMKETVVVAIKTIIHFPGKAQVAQAFKHSVLNIKGPRVRTYIFSSLAKRFLDLLVATSCLG